MQNNSNSAFRLNGIESNIANYNLTRDWEFSIVFANYLASNLNGSLYSISLSKKFEPHYFYLRYTPGYQKQFVFSSGIVLKLNNNVDVESQLKTNLTYQELFGFGYSYNISNKFTAGFSLQYFTQQFTEEQPDAHFSDTLNYLTTSTLITNDNFFNINVGFSYKLSEHLRLGIFSENLMTLDEQKEKSVFSLRKDKGAAFLIGYSPSNYISFSSIVESSSSFQFGINSSAKLFDGIISLGINFLHDKYQEPFITAFQPIINFSLEPFSVTIGATKYFKDRSNSQSLSKFLAEGINSVINNRYSNDKIYTAVNFALSFVPQKLVKIIDVDVLSEVYPTLSEEYLTNPIAKGRVINVTDKFVTVRPACSVEGVTDGKIYSPAVNIPPHDTAEVPFFIIFNNNAESIAKREIAQINFYVTTVNRDPDDVLQKPILINDINSWDGIVSHLRYFVRKNLSFAEKYAKEILSQNQSFLTKVKPEVEIFQKVKVLYNNFIKGMIYVADPRASAEKVQFLEETLKLKGGDCDDFSSAFSSILESIGIQTAFVDFKAEDGVSHVNIIFDTELPPEKAFLITNNDKKYFIRKNAEGKDEVWIPLETTVLTSFEDAWSAGVEKFNKEALDNYGLAKGKVEIHEVY
ncbi:transglutaminase domain-containing protein [Melioribacteraceae bacterium 4301-Me]|uniref:transglutaminase domain-containing protein n=1 Tax=Pyranulibacter aquaticus TaxID=3163344 RepID=UPI00359BBBA8